MPKLKYVEKQVYYVQYNDIEDFVKEVTGRSYEFVSSEECSNDIVLQQRVYASPLAEYEQKLYNDFVDGKNPSYVMRALLQKFCNDGLIPPGNYMINVSW